MPKSVLQHPYVLGLTIFTGNVIVALISYCFANMLQYKKHDKRYDKITDSISEIQTVFRESLDRMERTFTKELKEISERVIYLESEASIKRNLRRETDTKKGETSDGV
jgi:signal transduction protein with GAF and PtsI domain